MIAVSPLIAATYLPHWIRKYREAHHDVEVIINVLDSSQISAELEAGHADIGLSRLQVSIRNGSCIRLYQEKTKLVCPHDGGDAESSPPLSLEALVSSSVLLSYNHPEYWEELLPEFKLIHPSIRTMNVSQVHVTKRFIEEGIGFSVLPASVIQREIAEGRVLELDERSLKLPFASTYLLEKYQKKEAEDFITILRTLI